MSRNDDYYRDFYDDVDENEKLFSVAMSKLVTAKRLRRLVSFR